MSDTDVGAHVDAPDVVVVGAGLGGMTTALAAVTDLRVRLLAAAPPGHGSTPWAQGGVAAAVGANDSTEAHARDTLAVSGGLGDPAVAGHVAAAAPEVAVWLATVGVGFDRRDDGTFALGREGGHATDRILHAAGDRTGAEIVRATAAALAASAVHVCAPSAAVRLLTGRSGVTGVLARGADGRVVAHHAPAVVLATVGVGQLYARTTNPCGTLGEGLALAARAGAVIADAEMVQFHPTAMAVNADPLPLVSEALRGAGAVLVDETGTRLLADHPLGSLAPRDVVARAVRAVLQWGGRVGLDARAVFTEDPDRFPAAAAGCAVHGIDPAREPIPVTPAAHYHMGGVAADVRGRTTVPGLWAVGEVAATGLHGANRLASNSLLEAAVVGRAAARDIVKLHRAGELLGAGEKPRDGERRAGAAGSLKPVASRTADDAGVDEIRALLWRHAGPTRTEEGLGAVIDQLEAIRAIAPPDSATGRAALTGLLVATAARERRESRGAHVREDWPRSDPAQARRRGLVLRADGRLRPAAVPKAGGPSHAQVSA